MNRLLRKCKRKKNYTEVLGETHPLLGDPEKNNLQCNHGIIIDSEVTLKDCEDLGKVFCFIFSGRGNMMRE